MAPMSQAMQFALFIAFVLATGSAHAADEAARAWDALRGDGHVALVRHASAPGVGEPAGYRLGDCKTQRNLKRNPQRFNELVSA